MQVETWWQNHCEEEKNKVIEIERENFSKEKAQVETWWQNHSEEEKNKAIEIEREFFKKKQEEIEFWWQKHCQEIQNDYKKQLEEQKEYYEKKFLLVRITLKICRLIEKAKNKIKKIWIF